jgi:hypothetical protein
LEISGANFPSLGKFSALFSKPWKNFREIFQPLEKPMV